MTINQAEKVALWSFFGIPLHRGGYKLENPCSLTARAVGFEPKILVTEAKGIDFTA